MGEDGGCGVRVGAGVMSLSPVLWGGLRGRGAPGTVIAQCVFITAVGDIAQVYPSSMPDENVEPAFIRGVMFHAAAVIAQRAIIVARQQIAVGVVKDHVSVHADPSEVSQGCSA